ncbi:MAG: hypothetical protein GX654_13230 [Desulfatiglans sp.]|mgnify:CR=1 FL=1|jgi:hypothetical protein|nr:hypothetical protein [Desulfatiglans sp.]
MADPHWTSYVGMVTGILGAVTGIAGAILGCMSYKKSNQIKALDLRIELKRALANTVYDFKKLNDQMTQGNKSRIAVSSAIGAFRSGMMEKWKKEFENDQETSYELSKEIPDENTDYDTLNTKGLETELIKLHRIQRRIQTLTEKYDAAMEWDNEQRKHLREDRIERAK